MSTNEHKIQGGRATAIIYGGYLDQIENQQLYALLDNPAFEGSSVRIMPDHHAGKGCMIGFTCPINMSDPKIVPNVVGSDIGCGVVAYPLVGVKAANFLGDRESFDQHLRRVVPFGFNNRQTVYKGLADLFKKHLGHGQSFQDFEKEVNALDKKIEGDQTGVWLGIGSMGQNNHFLEVDQDSETSDLWLTAHSGSRNFGLRVCNWHQKRAEQRVGQRAGLAWLSDEEALEYLHDMRLAQQTAILNRLVMLCELLAFFKVPLEKELLVTSVHNYIGDDNIIRKGAISAYTGETCIVPFNMEDGLILARGRGNPDWNNSAPHGAGRIMSRGQARKDLSVEEYETRMQKSGVWSSCVGKDTIDEGPANYKPMQEILDAIGDTVEVVKMLKPLYNFKAAKKIPKKSHKE